MRKLFVLALLLVSSVSVYAQEVDSFIELLRSDVKTNKKAIITAAMDFTDTQASVFWPIYRNYEFDLDKLGDARVTMIKDYAENYQSMTDAKAKELMEKAFKFQEERLKLRRKYFNEISKTLSPMGHSTKVALYAVSRMDRNAGKRSTRRDGREYFERRRLCARRRSGLAQAGGEGAEGRRLRLDTHLPQR